MPLGTDLKPGMGPAYGFFPTSISNRAYDEQSVRRRVSPREANVGRSDKAPRKRRGG